MTTAWKNIWKKKGDIDSTDLKLLDGFEHPDIDEKNVAEQIIRELNIKKTDKVLEVGCGAGMIAQHLAPNCKYVGIDYTEALVKKHIEILNNSVLVAKADDIPFKDKCFDKTFAYSVFHYFPTMNDAIKVLGEMDRIAKGSIFIGDLPLKSHDKSHLLYPKKYFEFWNHTEGFYNKDRYNVVLKRGKS